MNAELRKYARKELTLYLVGCTVLGLVGGYIFRPTICSAVTKSLPLYIVLLYGVFGIYSLVGIGTSAGLGFRCLLQYIVHGELASNSRAPIILSINTALLCVGVLGTLAMLVYL